MEKGQAVEGLKEALEGLADRMAAECSSLSSDIEAAAREAAEASAVISDIITAMRESRYPEYHTGFNPYAKACGIMHINDTVTPYYVRFQVADQPGVIAEIARILATFGIGISATSSAPSHIDEGGAPWNDLVFILHSCPWGQLQKALEEITRISCVAAEPRVLRIEHLLPQS